MDIMTRSDRQVVLDNVRWCLGRILEEQTLVAKKAAPGKRLERYEMLVSDVNMKLSGLADWLQIH